MMGVRAMTARDLDALIEIDGTIESETYLHIISTADDGDGDSLKRAFTFEPRKLGEPAILANRLDQPAGEETLFMYRQVVRGIEEGEASVIEVAGTLMASMVAVIRPESGLLELIDLRVDYDSRREGLATALLFSLVSAARQRAEHDQTTRAILAQVAAKNVPAMRLLAKAGFELAGVDTRRRTNHDLVKEAATLFWYQSIDI